MSEQDRDRDFNSMKAPDNKIVRYLFIHLWKNYVVFHLEKYEVIFHLKKCEVIFNFKIHVSLPFDSAKHV